MCTLLSDGMWLCYSRVLFLTLEKRIPSTLMLMLLVPIWGVCVCACFFPPVFLLLSLTLSWPHKTAHFDVLIHMAA